MERLVSNWCFPLFPTQVYYFIVSFVTFIIYFFKKIINTEIGSLKLYFGKLSLKVSLSFKIWETFPHICMISPHNSSERCDHGQMLPPVHRRKNMQRTHLCRRNGSRTSHLATESLTMWLKTIYFSTKCDYLTITKLLTTGIITRLISVLKMWPWHIFYLLFLTTKASVS